jgi:hypothetical protein
MCDEKKNDEKKPDAGELVKNVSQPPIPDPKSSQSALSKHLQNLSRVRISAR